MARAGWPGPPTRHVRFLLLAGWYLLSMVTVWMLALSYHKYDLHFAEEGTDLPLGAFSPEDHPAIAERLRLYPAPSVKPRTNDSKPFPSSYFTICAVVKNQNADIREWIHYHHWLGAKEMYIYDHNSTRPLLLDIDDWVRSGVVIYNRFAGRHKVLKKKNYLVTAQAFAYADCLRRAKDRHKWIAFIDVDEFLVLSGNTSDITKFLRPYEPYGGVAVNWRVFGSAGHIHKPKGHTLEQYTKCIPDWKQSHNIHVKTIVNVNKTRSIGGNPHTFRHHDGYFPVTETFRECRSPQCVPVSANQIALHHYTLKSLAEYQVKMARGGGSGSVKKMDFFESINTHAKEVCLQGVRAAMQCYAQNPP